MRVFYLSLGSLALSLGIIGLFLPLLPTTPFLLLAALCFSKSDERLHRWLLHHPLLGPPIVDWQRYRVISVRAKIFAAVTMLMGLTSVWIFFPPELAMAKSATLALMIGVLIFILVQKSKRTDDDL